MPITFDTLEELKDFYLSFRLDEKSTGKTRRSTTRKAAIQDKKSEAPKERKKPGRKPKATSDKKAATPKTATKAVKAPAKKTPKAAAKKPAKPRGRSKETLTSKIQATIQSFLNKKKSFTANDVYDDLSKRVKGVNKQSVITSVLKQMNTTFKNVSVTERPGAGPRPVKLYNA